jgi:hypothetical protein
VNDRMDGKKGLERETGLEPLIPNFAVVNLTEEHGRLLDDVICRLRPLSPSPLVAAIPTKDGSLQQMLKGLVGTPLGRALDDVLEAATAARDRERRRWGTKILLQWSADNNVDLGSMDEVALRETYRVHLSSKYSQVNVPMWLAHRVLEAIDRIRMSEPGSFPALPSRPITQKAAPPRLPRGTDLVHALDDASPAAAAARALIAGAPSRIQAKVRRYAIGQFLTWCRETEREPDQVTFEEIDGSFTPWARARVKNWTELGVHARKMVRLIAAGDPDAQLRLD